APKQILRRFGHQDDDHSCHHEPFASLEGKLREGCACRSGHVHARTMLVFALLGISVGLMLYCGRPNDDRVAVPRQATTQIEDAEHRRAAATTVMVEAKAGARAAEVEANAAVSRAAKARALARVAGAKKVT